MKNIELVIKVPEDLYEAYKGRPPMLGDAGMDMIAQAIPKGKALPKEHGRLIVLSEDGLKKNQINVDFSPRKWIGEVGLEKATVAIIEADKGE